MFALEREERIIRSKVREYFTPHAPIKTRDLLAGRDTEVARLIEILNTPGQHALLYGDRGVGKSSLGFVAAIVLGAIEMGGQHWVKRCDSTDDFAAIVRPILKAAGIDTTIAGVQESYSRGGNAGVNIPFFDGGVSTGRESTTSRVSPAADANSPAWVAEATQHLKGVFLIDEADAISAAEDRKRLAEFIKQLSDHRSTLKILVVGIADTQADLTGGHPSVDRCLKEVKLKRMPEKELRKIIEIGSKASALKFDDKVTATIVDLSAGYPHFTHLLALKCAEDAVADGRVLIGEVHLESAVARAVQDAEESLLKQYQQATMSSSTENYKRLLCAAACCPGPDFSNKEWRERMKELFSVDMAAQALNNYLGKLVSDDGDKIIRRTARGVYRFRDPRMPSFIKIAEKLHRKPKQGQPAQLPHATQV